ncbi:MAG: hypothetical protein ACI9XU_001129 [Arenicella sp.]|jgi:hypothetical protein
MSTRPPTLNGLKTMINIPAAKFDSEPCSASPTAKPAAPSTAINDAA